jgi:hypothetical protein
MSKISNTVTTTVTLGSPGYGSPLTITQTGAIAPTTYGATALYSDVANGRITNDGMILGAAGAVSLSGAAGNGGIGIDLAAATKLSNAGTIAGGAGGGSMTGTPGVGGDAIYATGAITIKNTGDISAGTGGALATDFDYAGSGGIGIAGAAATLDVTNKGTIQGGAAGRSAYTNSTPPANGGAGIQVENLTLTNSGSIFAGNAPGDVEGNGYGAGGVGIQVSGTANITNHGLIQGGYGIYGSYHSISRYSGAAGGPGGAGLSLAQGKITNTGTILGGAGGAGGLGGTGGAGITLAGATLVNSGVITGGKAGGAPGGDGVYSKLGTVTNTGTITGGYADGRYNNLGGAGVLLAGGTLSNAGDITGGWVSKNTGGAGVVIDGGIFTNSGTVTGGHANQGGAQPGAGVSISAGTLITSGMIYGGYGHMHVLADAVYVDPNATSPVRIIAEPGLAFHGNVVGNADTTLELAGRKLGRLIGIGSTITGIPTIVEDAHADWKLLAASSLAAGVSLSAAGTLELGGAFSGAGTLTLDSGGIVTADLPLSVTNVDFASGGHETLVLDAPTSTTSTFTGFAANDKIDLANLVATTASFSAGTLTLLDGSSTVATLLLDGSYTSANFTLTSDGNGGTDIKYVATLSDFAPPTAPSSQHPAAYAWSEPSYLHLVGPAAPDLLFWPDFTHGRL